MAAARKPADEKNLFCTRVRFGRKRQTYGDRGRQGKLNDLIETMGPSWPSALADRYSLGSEGQVQVLEIGA